MRVIFPARPSSQEILCFITFIQIRLICQVEENGVEILGKTVISYFITGAEVEGQVAKWSFCETQIRSSSAATEAECNV
jgi:hypothetical protein